MPSSTSHSPRRKRIRRYLSATGTRWSGRPPSSSSSKPRRGSSASTAPFSFSPHDTSDRSDSDYGHELDDGDSALFSPPGRFMPLPEDRDPPLAYASLPPTPISSSPQPDVISRSGPSTFPSRQQESTRHTEDDREGPPFSLWDYLREELLATDFDSHQELKWERVGNFLSMPVAIEKIMLFGFVLCLDSFLYTFTILPIRFALASMRLLRNTFSFRSPPLPPSQKADILRALLLVCSIVILSPLTDASKIYHSIRGQDTIKLYVIFNALEIADRLCGSIGQDIIDCLFSRSTLEVISHRKRPTSHTLTPFFYFLLALIYVVCHTLVMIYQTISLNVAVNSYDHALLTLLVSNQFVEIKGSVFKKFEKDNLFQITCADIVERFTLSLMLIVVAFRNLIELSGSSFSFGEGSALPKSFGWFRGNNVLWTISYPVVTVLASETLVDWLKHAFIAKFNHIRPSVYERYMDVLSRDLLSREVGDERTRRGRKHTYVDQSPLVARRLGFAALPLAVLAILIGSQSINLLILMHVDESSAWSFDGSWSMWKGLFGSLSLQGLVQNVYVASSKLWHIDWQESVASVLSGDWTEMSKAAAAWIWARAMEVTISEELVNVAKWSALGMIVWVCMVVIKLILGVNLLSYASRRRMGMDARAVADDAVNDFGRSPIGEGSEEQKYNRELKTILDDPRDDTAPVAEVGERSQSGGGETNKDGAGKADGGKRKRLPLEEITRYTMVKRIW